MGKNNLKQTYQFGHILDLKSLLPHEASKAKGLHFGNPFSPYRWRSVPVPTFISIPTINRVCLL